MAPRQPPKPTWVTSEPQWAGDSSYVAASVVPGSNASFAIDNDLGATLWAALSSLITLFICALLVGCSHVARVCCVVSVPAAGPIVVRDRRRRQIPQR